MPTEAVAKKKEEPMTERRPGRSTSAFNGKIEFGLRPAQREARLLEFGWWIEFGWRAGIANIDEQQPLRGERNLGEAREAHPCIGLELG